MHMLLLLACAFLHNRYEVMMKCWEWTPEDRPTFSDLVTLLSGVMESEAGYMAMSPP